MLQKRQLFHISIIATIYIPYSHSCCVSSERFGLGNWKLILNAYRSVFEERTEVSMYTFLQFLFQDF